MERSADQGDISCFKRQYLNLDFKTQQLSIWASLGTRPSHVEEEEGLVNFIHTNLKSAEFRRNESDWLMTV